MSDIKFQLTCGACPEQYDLFEDDEIIAYFRLRWGHFSVQCPDIGGTAVYTHSWDEEYKGCFYDPVERDHYLREAFKAISEHYGREIPYPEDYVSKRWEEIDEGLQSPS